MTATPMVEDSPQGKFIAHLYNCDAGERAELRRCLAADKPSDHLPAYRLVEKRAAAAKGWQRECYYLVAGLFALVERKPPKGRGATNLVADDAEPPLKALTLARAVKIYESRAAKGEGNMSSVERCFLALLDSDRDQLPYRLRQMLQMITKGQNAVSAPLSWIQLLKDLQYWREDDQDRVRQRWASEFYEPSEPDDKQTNEETKP